MLIGDGYRLNIGADDRSVRRACANDSISVPMSSVSGWLARGHSPSLREATGEPSHILSCRGEEEFV